MRYDDLAKLHELRQQNALTEEEYQREKTRLLERPAGGAYAGMDLSTFCMVLHLSQLLNLVMPFVGSLLTIVLWAIFRQEHPDIAAHGRSAINWIITSGLATLVAIPLCLVLIGIPLLFAIWIAGIVFAIIAGVKAKDGVVWDYPLTIRFLKG